MITIDFIKENAKERPYGGGKQCRIGNDRILFSIVGGANGLYGDFENEFEVAIIEQEKGNFVTQYYYSGLGDDVISYMKGEDLIKFINEVLKDNFRVL